MFASQNNIISQRRQRQLRQSDTRSKSGEKSHSQEGRLKQLSPNKPYRIGLNLTIPKRETYL
jgi:hypothetical protein